MAKKLEPGRKIKPKRKCCNSAPRCKRCPVMLRRLEQRGFAERRGDGTFVMLAKVPKAERKAARGK